MSTNIQLNNQKDNIDWKFLNYAWDLEKVWKELLRQEYPKTNAELLKVFQPSKAILKKKIDDWQEKKIEILKVIETKLTALKYSDHNDTEKFLWRELIKIVEGSELIKVNSHIARIKRLSFVANGRVPKGQLTEEQIEQARRFPIENILNKPFRKSGRAVISTCPFHNEKTPSFYIYPEDNSFYCFGCQKNGDAITFVRLLNNCSFREAVKYLL